MAKHTFVWVTTQFQGFHRWLDAPESVGFLRAYHRHLFHVRLEVEVAHNNRDVEFFALKANLEAFIAMKYLNRYFEESCEMIAHAIYKEFVDQRYDVSSVTVSEDGENGAAVVNYGV